MTLADCSGIIDKYYPADRPVRGILLCHSRNVADLALALARRAQLRLDPELIEAAAMLHDIGIIATDAPGIDCHGSAPYLLHGVIGADMLRQCGADERVARVAERHTGAGISRGELRSLHLPLPDDRTLMPLTTLEKLICYADCFYSKTGLNRLKDIGRVRSGMQRHGMDQCDRFERLVQLFGDPANL